MSEFIKIFYRFKIKLMFYFGLGWNEFATPVAVVRDIAVVLTFIKLVLGISFGWKIDGLICIVSMGLFVLIGFIMKESGMADYGTKIGNSINPELQLIRQIWEKIK